MIRSKNKGGRRRRTRGCSTTSQPQKGACEKKSTAPVGLSWRHLEVDPIPPADWGTRSTRSHLGKRPEHEVPDFCSRRGGPGGARRSAKRGGQKVASKAGTDPECGGLLNWLSHVMRVGTVCALRAGVHVACTCRVCAPHMLCACASGGTACFIGIVCVRECGPVRVSGTSDRVPLPGLF
jgi:hypothetical protein